MRKKKNREEKKKEEKCSSKSMLESVDCKSGLKSLQIFISIHSLFL